jgi:hypothetical protein
MSAVILQLPATAQRTAQRRLNRLDIEGRHRWMRKHRDKWDVTETDGFEPEEYVKPRVRQLMELLDKEWGVVPKPTVAAMKKEIAQGRKVIEERNRIKAWLVAQGVDLGAINSTDAALSCMFRLVGVGSG